VVSARVKAEKQRGKQETDDEELVVQLDSIAFSKLANSSALKNSSAAFSGGTQHNQEKTVRILIELDPGDHQLVLTPQHRAEITQIWYEPVEVSNNQISLFLNQRASSSDNRPWITFVLIGQGFTKITMTAKVRWRWFDGDDLQVRINGKVAPNNTSQTHKKWVFSAVPGIDIFGREQTETFSLSQEQQEMLVQYVELWADRLPVLKEILFMKEGPIANGGIPFPAIYSPGSNNEDYNHLDGVIAKTVHEWNEEFLNQEVPPPKPLDPSLVKALIYVESKVGLYHALDGNYPATPDVMQIADPRNPAIHTLKGDGWINPSTGQEALEYIWTPQGPKIMKYPEANAQTSYESIRWGVRWLYHKAEIMHDNGNRSWRSWREAVARYNGGGDPDYVRKVFETYEKGDWK